MKFLKQELIMNSFIAIIGLVSVYAFAESFVYDNAIVRFARKFLSSDMANSPDIIWLRLLFVAVAISAGICSLSFFQQERYYIRRMLERGTQELDEFDVVRYENNVVISVFDYENGPFRIPSGHHVWCFSYDMEKLTRLRSLLVEYRYNYKRELVSVTPFPYSKKNELCPILEFNPKFKQGQEVHNRRHRI
jgi:hypothetical protein